MPVFGKTSRNNLSSCHIELQNLFNEVIKYYDCSVLCGTRSKLDQDKAFREGRSRLKFPESKHNTSPSMAVDVVPYFSTHPHVRWNDTDKFYEFTGFVQGVAAMLEIDIICGSNWDMDDELHDQTLFDLPHFELKT
jgi:peptidoglycan L-alanyl-D-glutamate endopeptidase CwlK